MGDETPTHILRCLPMLITNFVSQPERSIRSSSSQLSEVFEWLDLTKASYPIIKLHLPLNKLQDNFNPTASLAVLCYVGLQRLATGANLRHTWWRFWEIKSDEATCICRRSPSWPVRLERGRANDFLHPPLDLDEFTPKTSPYGQVLYNSGPASCCTCRLPQRVCKRSGLSKTRLFSGALAAHVGFLWQVANL